MVLRPGWFRGAPSHSLKYGASPPWGSSVLGARLKVSRKQPHLLHPYRLSRSHKAPAAERGVHGTTPAPRQRWGSGGKVAPQNRPAPRLKAVCGSRVHGAGGRLEPRVALQGHLPGARTCSADKGRSLSSLDRYLPLSAVPRGLERAEPRDNPALSSFPRRKRAPGAFPR